MFPHQLIKGDIVIEGPDQVIPVTPRVGDIIIPFVAMRLGEPHHIHPMPGKMLAELRGRQQSLHHDRIGGGWALLRCLQKTVQVR